MATYDREVLAHFHCASCAGRWSISNPQARPGHGSWYCPWCGMPQVVTGPAGQPSEREVPPQPPVTEPRGRGPE